MGKRKERRLAALSNAGRRVKLDLFAEPPGDVGGDTLHGEVKGDIDPNQSAGLPKSPSSSGGQPQNPLLLLGQYSDDELDEESSRKPNDAIEASSPVDQDIKDGQVEGRNFVDGSTGDDLAVKADSVDIRRDATPSATSKQEGDDMKESETSASTDICKEGTLREQTSTTENLNAQVIGDVSSGWKMVFHEESNQYYYWNIETGETSWEVPDVINQCILQTTNQKTSVEDTESSHYVAKNTSFDANDSSATVPIANGIVEGSLILENKEACSDRPQVDNRSEGYKSIDVQDRSALVGFQLKNFQACSDTCNALSEDGNQGMSEHIQKLPATSEHDGDTDFPAKLISKCKCLLEKLNSLKGYGNQLRGCDWMSKHTLELEIRLDDIKSLLSYGSSLLPFWTHSERHLKQLEDTVNNEIYQLAVSAQLDDGLHESSDLASKDWNGTWESFSNDLQADGYDNSKKLGLSAAVTSVENNLHDQDACADVGNNGDPSTVGENLKGDSRVSEHVNSAAELSCEFDGEEDADMDVDMEVEDGAPTGAIGSVDASSNRDFAPVKMLDPPVHYSFFAPGGMETVPPPPGEEWIPPPPPDNYHVPPPPPDNEQVPPLPPGEPPESSNPPLPPYSETGQTLPYVDQYNFTYQDPNFQYYGQTVAVPSNTLYGHANGSEVGVPHASFYYGAVANAYAQNVPVIGSSIDSAAYYTLQDGTIPPGSGISSLESSKLPTTSGGVSSDAVSSDHVGAVDGSKEAAGGVNFDVSGGGDGTILPNSSVTSTAIIQAPATTNVEKSSSAPSASAAVAAQSAATKAQSKVGRAKRKTVVAPSLRSNKKVSGLVDKWKAAKEELNEMDEDEPENALEILEKKRQREIEEWHARQIARGEAKDNANFQPLGGDWRERVKRRRAQAAKEAASEAPAGDNKQSDLAKSDDNKQPNLAELSKGLPSGWQAYWDEMTKQVYYGNIMTSETCWKKPTR